MNVEIIKERCKMMFNSNLIVEVTPAIRKAYIELISEQCPDIPRIRIISILDREIKRITEPVIRKTFFETINHSLR